MNVLLFKRIIDPFLELFTEDKVKKKKKISSGLILKIYIFTWTNKLKEWKSPRGTETERA